MKFYKGEKLKNLGLLPDMAAEQNSGRTALFFREEEQTFDELSERSTQIASSLNQRGLKPGDRVGLYIPNSIQFPETFFGVIKAGCIPVSLNLRMPVKTLSYVIEDSDINWLIASSLKTTVSSPEQAVNLAEENNIENVIIPGKNNGGNINYESLFEEGHLDFEYPTRDYNDTVTHLYTSGTTGRPKGVPLSHENVLAAIEGFDKASGSDPESRMLHVLPLYHIYGLSAVLGVYIYKGATIVLQADPDPELLLKNIEKYNCTQFAGVPALFRMLWLVYQQEPEKYNLETLEEVVCAAAPLDETTRKKIKNEWKIRFAEGWGMSETSPAGTMNLGNVPKGAGCIGWPVNNIEMKITDPETRKTIVPWDTIAPWGDIKEDEIDAEGELAVRGPAVFDGYFNMPEKNKEVFDEDGWFYTGDLMKIDEDKALWMVERTDDMILSGGENIYPSEIEDALLEHDQISDAAIVPAPHKTKGEVPVAFVVLAPDADLTEQEIKDFALERVPTYAHPRKVFFKNNLPKSGALKTQHFKLEEEAKELIPEPLG